MSLSLDCTSKFETGAFIAWRGLAEGDLTRLTSAIQLILFCEQILKITLITCYRILCPQILFGM